MWIMIESQMRKVGQSLKGNRATLELMLPMMGKMAAESYPVFTSAPLYLRETLLFPYTAGMLFQQAVFEKSGKAAFAEVLRKPPASTQQVLHPERYFEALAPTVPALPEMEGLKEFEQLTKGSVGELDFRILLQQYTDEKQGGAIAPKWRGGTFDVLEHKRDEHRCCGGPWNGTRRRRRESSCRCTGRSWMASGRFAGSGRRRAAGWPGRVTMASLLSDWQGGASQELRACNGPMARRVRVSSLRYIGGIPL